MTEDQVVASASGPNIRAVLANVRKALGLPLVGSTRVKLTSGGEDSLYRVTLNNGMVVEVTIIQHAKCEIHHLNPPTLRNV